MRRSSFRGVVDVVFGGEKPAEASKEGVQNGGKGKEHMRQSGKRKVEDDGLVKEIEKPLSKTQIRKRAKQARMEKANQVDDETDKVTGDPMEAQATGDVPDAATIAGPVITGFDSDEVTATLLAAGVPREDGTAASFAALAEALVWSVDTCALDTGDACDGFAAISGNAPIGHRQEQSQGSNEAFEAGGTAGTAADCDVPLVVLESGVTVATGAAVSTWFKAPAVTTAREL
ncbi:MAG: hypothetical protein L6R39_007191 [Caloplaca ligustica]|nr:MAG: hypothetical protein L6R39_007191 [Caloplaca ligustica]